MLDRSYLASLALAGAILAVCAGAFAQAPSPSTSGAAMTDSATPTAPHHHRNRLRAALETLGLSDDQKTKIATIMRADRATFRAAQSAQTPPTPESKRAYQSKLRADVEGELTADQKAKLELALARHHRDGTGGSTPTVRPSPM